jgi:hypothetical protein
VLASLDVDLKQFWNENELNALLRDFRSGELSAPEPKLDQAAELQKKWKTVRGQIWEIGQHRLICGDSASASDVSALMNGNTARLCATDPPYLVSYDARNHPSKDFSDGKNKDWKGRYADKQKTEPLGPFYEAFLRQALAVCEADAAIYVWHASQRQIEVEKAMRNCGILVHQQIIWVKNKPVLTHSFYMWQHEPCFFGWKQGPGRLGLELPKAQRSQQGGRCASFDQVRTAWRVGTVIPSTATALGNLRDERAWLSMNSLFKPGDFPLGSPESRAMARAQLERSERKPGQVLRIRVIHIGVDSIEPLPQAQTYPWQGGVTEIIHTADSSS